MKKAFNSLSSKLKSNLYTILFIFLLGFLPFIFNINDPFVSDDWHFLYLTINNDYPLYHYFTSNYTGTHSGGSYRPMINVFWTSAYNLFGLNSSGYHILGLLFHTLNIGLIFLIVKKLPWFQTKKGKKEEDKNSKLYDKLTGVNKKEMWAWLSAIIFAVLPNHASAVSWISVVNDTLMTTFYLSAIFLFLLAYLNQKKKLYYSLSLLFFALALLTKEMAITLPGILGMFVLYDLFKKSTKEVSAIVKKLLTIAPYAIILALFFVVRYFAIGLFLQSYTGPVKLSLAKVSRAITSFFISNFATGGVRISATGFAFLHYKTVLVAGAVVILVLLWVAKKRKWSYLPFLLFGGFLLSLIPVLQYTVNYSPAYINEEGSRYAYLPSIFIATLLAYIFSALWFKLKKKRYVYKGVVTGLFFLIISYFSFSLVQQNLKWDQASKVAESTLKNTISIWKQEQPDGMVLVGTPDSYRGAFIFRNGLSLAMDIKLGSNFSIKDILITKAKTMYDSNQNFEVNRKQDYNFNYYEENNKPLLVSASQSTLSSQDYNFKLNYDKFNLYALSFKRFGSSLEFELTKEFIKQNQNKDIKLLFFDNKDWIKKEIP